MGENMMPCPHGPDRFNAGDKTCACGVSSYEVVCKLRKQLAEAVRQRDEARSQRDAAMSSRDKNMKWLATAVDALEWYAALGKADVTSASIGRLARKALASIRGTEGK